MTTNRADKFTIKTKTVERYSDFLVNFDKNPLTGFLARTTNADAIKQSLRNLILTERTERPYQPHIGSKIWSLLFEPIDVVTEELLKQTIKETISNCEPRVNVIQISVNGNANYNSYFVEVVFEILNIPGESFSLPVILRRVR